MPTVKKKILTKFSTAMQFLLPDHYNFFCAGRYSDHHIAATPVGGLNMRWEHPIKTGQPPTPALRLAQVILQSSVLVLSIMYGVVGGVTFACVWKLSYKSIRQSLALHWQ